MKKSSLFNIGHPFTPFFQVANDAGGGAGGADSVSSGGAGAPGAAAGADGSGAGTGQAGSGARTISDNDMVLIDGKPVRWADARTTHYMPKSQYDQGVQFLTTVAQRLEAQERAGRGNVGQAQRQTQTQNQPPRDPFADIENQAVIDGRTFAKYGRELVQRGFGEMGQVVTALVNRIQQLEQGTQGIGKTVGSLAENHSNTEFESFVTNTLKAVPEIPGLGMIPADNPLIREIAKDVFLSHDQKDPTLMKEFPRMVQERVSEMFKLFTTMQKDYVTAAKSKQRAFFDPAKGTAKPTGPAKYVHKSPDEIAREFFSATSGT